jgi:REP-associated tyrosine transposase
MPRRARCLLTGRYFHVTARGVAGETIFRDEGDRQRFVLYLHQTTELWGWRLIAWCLMGTHYHLVVEAEREQMSLAVHRLNCLYAMYFNRRHDRRGHLFENRFGSWIIRDEDHLNATVAYVTENPVRAGICLAAADWPWSWPRPRSAVALSKDGIAA